ncbi:MAG TPA: DUF4157 domain-containing protein [Cellvibrio sp.]|nr:DUF4157 domain-containing protein [Cellvibrio sp.]
MATLAQKKRSGKSGGHDNKTAQRQAEEKKDSPAQRKVMRSAYLQTKMAVSTPGDTQEQEADRVADEVSRMPKGVARTTDETAPPGSSKPENNAEQPQSLQTKISRMEEEPDTARTKLCRAEAENLNTKAARTEEEDVTAQTKLHRQEEGPTTTEIDAEAASPETPIVADETEQKIESLRGQGNPMADDIRQEMEGKLHADFSRVSIHTSGDADALCKQLSARAFTVGNDIFFAAGEYAPTTEAGRKLLVHELTHVVQQSEGLQRKIMREGDDTTATADTDNGLYQSNGYIEFSQLLYPTVAQVTSDHFGSYTPLIRHKNYSGNRSTRQSEIFSQHMSSRLSAIKDKLKLAPGYSADADQGFLVFKVPSPDHRLTGSTGGENVKYLMGSLDEIAANAIRPTWTPEGRNAPLQGRKASYEVDHIVEAQVGANSPRGGYEQKSNIDAIGNFILLRGRKNQQKGDTLKENILEKVRGFVRNNDATYGGRAFRDWDVTALKNRLSMKFNGVNYSGSLHGGGTITDEDVWQISDLENGVHIQALLDASPVQIRCVSLSNIEENIREGNILLFHSLQGGLRRELRQNSARDGRILMSGARDMLSPFKLHDDSRIHNVESADATTSLATLYFYIPENSASKLPPLEKSEPVDVVSINGSLKSGAFAEGRLSALMGLRQEITGMSPIEVDGVSLTENGLAVTGRINPSVSLIEDASVDFEINGDSLTVSKTFMMEEINVPEPFSVIAASVTVSGGTRGFELSGNIDFEIDKIGSGMAQASYHSRDGVSLAGTFNFDERIFGEGTNAQIRFDYASGLWTIGGTVTIPSGKVPGISTATIEAEYSQENGFHASGEAQLTVPGIESGTMEISHNEDEGFVIGGSFNLSSDIPGIRSGSISARVVEREDGSGYAVSATGTAQPDIPGINSELVISYNDGAFTAEIEADYSRGMLSGRVNAGVTNRSVGEDGQTLSETAEPDNPLIVYGGGSLSLQLAPWLQATAGVQFSPNGEITVTGEIGLPDELEIFARREINKSIFNIAVQAPIFPGIVAEIGGGLSATAGIGPGVVDQLRLGVTYNPDHEEDTHITGDAHLNIPANAGLRLSVRAGIGLGITGASATGGLDIGGTLGIEGAAEAGVHVDWTPATGLDIEAEVAVHAQPSFTFDIGGYVSVRALGFSVYDERWEFASYTFGSDYRFGIRLPIHYKEGEPFDISLDDVEFEVPDIDTNQLLRGLIARIA